MFDVVGLEYVQRALAAGLIVGLVCPLIGVFLVLRRLALIGDGLGHAAFAGVAAGLLFGATPLLAALLATMAGAAAIEWLRSRERGRADLWLALLFHTSIGAGVVMIGVARGFNATLFGYLFGSVLTVSVADVLAVAGLGAVVVAGVALFYKELFLLTLDEESARVSGLPVGALNFGLALLTALTVVVAMRVVGVLLVAALMAVPVATALQVSRSFRATLFWAMASGVASVLAGLALAYALDLAPGGAIVLTAIGGFGMASAVRWIRTAAA